MLTFTFRRLLLAIPTLVLISLIIFLLLDLAPGDPLADQPLSIPPEVRQKMRDALGLDSPAYVRYLLWAKQFFWVEPLVFVDWVAGTSFSEGMQRIVSWQFRAPVFDIIIQRLPQTLWVVGTSYIVGILIGVPLGIISAYKQYSCSTRARPSSRWSASPSRPSSPARWRSSSSRSGHRPMPGGGYHRVTTPRM
jgi:peptide/nickel transport system permease protein